MEEPTTWLAAVAAFFSALAALTSVVIATVALVLQGRWSSADALLRVSQQFETTEFRTYRSIIYALERDNFSSWSEEETSAVNTWCAHLDLVASLIESKQLRKSAILKMYGDVTLRTIYQVAPYCNHQVGIRGPQFLLPLRTLTYELIKTWRREARYKRFPITIGFPAQPQLRVNPDLFDSDDAVVKFRVKRKLR